MEYEWINSVAKMSDDHTSIIFFREFNKFIEPNSLPENLTNLTFGYHFNQKIEPNSLPENLTTLIFGCQFNQKIGLEILLYNLKYIFLWLLSGQDRCSPEHIQMVNNIPRYYDVKIIVNFNRFDIDGSKWPIHVTHYREFDWSSKIYGNITVLINKDTYEPYSLTKSARK